MAGHRGWRTTKASIIARFWWTKMSDDIEDFVKSCLHCLATQPGKVIPRPLGHALHASKPNELLHFDFCYMAPGVDNQRYILILNDDHSGYVWLVPTSETDAATVADALLKWFASFGVVRTWVSDRGSHFKNQLIQLLQESMKSHHHFTLAYCPWSNGTVEVVCRELLHATRALLSEFQLPSRSWPTVLPVVQSALNSALLPRLGNQCPLTAFTGLQQESPLRTIAFNRNDIVKLKSISEARAAQALEVSRTIQAMESMHKHVSLLSNKKRQSAVNSHNNKTSVKAINFSTGDFVLRGALDRQRGSKPGLKWHGPFRVIDCQSQYIFEIEDLLTAKKELAHGRRLKFFRNKDFEVTEELKDYLAYQSDEIFVIDRFDDIRKQAGKIQVLVAWKGFNKDE
eukprot:IDg12252t1